MHNSTKLTTEEMTQQIRCVSHEIRNHLSICDMYSQIIRKNLEKEGVSNPSINNAIDCIQKSVQIISSNLLELKSLNSTTLQITDFANCINKSIELSKAYIIDKDIEIEHFIKNSGNIKIDENKFLACLVNIIKNGIEAIEIKGKIEILAEVKDNFAIVKIANNGKAIPKDKQETIFDSGYTTKKTGCGLGLAICKKYFDSIGAEIKLTKSTKNQTQFEIRIPTVVS